MTEPPRSSDPGPSPGEPPSTPDLAARRKAIEMAMASETELYHERMAAYQRQLADLERQAIKSADCSPQSARP